MGGCENDGSLVLITSVLLIPEVLTSLLPRPLISALWKKVTRTTQVVTAGCMAAENRPALPATPPSQGAATEQAFQGRSPENGVTSEALT